MSVSVFGRLHAVFEEIRVVSLRRGSRIEFFYMGKGMFASFLQYLGEGVYVWMTVSDLAKKTRGVQTRFVERIDRLMLPHGATPKVFYDANLIKSGIRTLVNARKPKLFIDFEMSMPPFKYNPDFISELIQCGMILTDDTGNTLEEHTTFIRPFMFPEITDRTRKFLKITQGSINQGIEFPEFHGLLDRIITQYRPMVMVWGQNDIIELRKAALYHRMPDITKKAQFVDLLKLHKNYFGLKNDVGLFNAYRVYSEIDPEKQAHDALEDATVTKLVYEGFRKVCNGDSNVVFKNPEPAPAKPAPEAAKAEPAPTPAVASEGMPVPAPQPAAS
ncbi:MAG: 3'-5' exonuclease [Candidatus Izemoplasmatales bacterium]